MGPPAQARCDARGLTDEQCATLRLNVTKFLSVADLNITAEDCELLQVADKTHGHETFVDAEITHVCHVITADLIPIPILLRDNSC